MRGAILYVLLSGIAWFVCAAVVLAIAILDLARAFDRRRRLARAAGFAVLLAIPLAALTGTPLPLVAAIPIVAAASAYAISGVGKTGRRRLVPALAALAAVAAIALEVPHFVRDRAPVRGRVVVIGDSLSSGGFGEAAAWPELLRASGRNVVNVSRPSETLESAVRDRLAESIRPGDAVIVAVGGNDLLGGTDPRLFARDLETLVAQVRRAGAAEIFLLELPLPAGKWAYGRAQRRIAGRFGVHVIPKRVVLRVVADPDLTDDGLHPTSAGHRVLAREIGRSLALLRE